MSTPARDGPDVPGKKKGLLSRMKTVVLKRSDGSKRMSFSSKHAVPGEASTSRSKPVPEPIVEPVTTPKPAAANIPAGATRILRSQIDADRARKLGERFAVLIEPLTTIPDRETYRIEKPIRMRIHRSCHLCQTTFGNNKICAQCQHSRCKACPRYPAKKTAAEKKDMERDIPVISAVDRIEADTYYGSREQMLLTKPNPKPGCQPLVRKKPKQRVRRTCHLCKALFGPGVRTCAGCEHVRCADCPRDPAKRTKYPDGYPGDAPSSDTSRPVKYLCHKCNRVFPPTPHPDSSEGIALKQSIANGEKEQAECVRCKHVMCGDCPRAPPVRIEPAPDPDVLAAVREKLASLDVKEV